MKFFLKLNAISMIYAFILLIDNELKLNIYRISRITELSFDLTIPAIKTIQIIGFIFCTVLLYLLIRSLFQGRKLHFIGIFLWFPYYILFRILFDLLFPFTNGQDHPNPVSGLIIMFELILYPLYLAGLNFFVNARNGEEN